MFELCVLCIPMQLSTVFYIYLVFLTNEVTVSMYEAHVMPELFSNLSVTLEQIYIFRTSIIYSRPILFFNPDVTVVIKGSRNLFY